MEYRAKKMHAQLGDFYWCPWFSLRVALIVWAARLDVAMTESAQGESISMRSLHRNTQVWLRQMWKKAKGRRCLP